MFIFDCTRFITSIGHGEPAMMPVRRLFRSNSAKRGWSSWAIEHGRHAVERRAALPPTTACKVASGSNASAG
jgi:hypothetical protein